jgi:hypothetical protein
VSDLRGNGFAALDAPVQLIGGVVQIAVCEHVAMAFLAPRDGELLGKLVRHGQDVSGLSFRTPAASQIGIGQGREDELGAAERPEVSACNGRGAYA